MRQPKDRLQHISRNVMVGMRRTSVRMEPAIWEAVDEICAREACSQRDLFTWIEERRGVASLTAAIRIFIISYFRIAVEQDRPVGRALAEGDGQPGSLSDLMLHALEACGPPPGPL